MFWSLEPFPNACSVIFALSPLNSSWICNCVCKFKWCHIIYGFGVVYSKDCNGDVFMMFCATHVNKVWPPDPESSVFLLAPSQLQCMLDMMFICSFQVLFHVIFNHPSQSHPLTYCHMQSGWFPTIFAPSLCQIHRHYSVSGIDVLLSRCLNSCKCFVVHAILTCYLHLN